MGQIVALQSSNIHGRATRLSALAGLRPPVPDHGLYLWISVVASPSDRRYSFALAMVYSSATSEIQLLPLTEVFH